jgi:Zn-dependent protease
MRSLIFWFQWFFTKTLPAGRLLGIPLRVHLALVLFVPFLGYAFYKGWAPALGPLGGLLFALLYIAVLYLSVTAHEYGHAWGNRLIGGRTEMIILTPIGGMAMGSGADASPRAELIVTALGPAVSVLLAAAAHAGLWLLPSPGALWADGRMLALWGVLLVGIIASVNTMLALFNLLFPLFPMDSARLIRAALALRYNPQQVTLRVCQLGTGLGIALLMAFFFRVQLPFLGMVSGWLALIGILGIQACLWEQDRIRQMPVYGRSDEWGARTVYYDNDLVLQARRQASDDVRGLLRLKPDSTSRRRAVASRGGTARIIDLAEPANPEDITDRRKLAEMMREAANNEDFLLAGRIQRRLRHLDQQETTREG